MKYFFLFFSNRSKVLKTNFKFIQRTNTKLYKIRKFTFRFEAFSFRLGASTGAATTTNNNNNKQQQTTTTNNSPTFFTLNFFEMFPKLHHLFHSCRYQFIETSFQEAMFATQQFFKQSANGSLSRSCVW